MNEVQLPQGYRATTKRQFFYHLVPRNFWYLFDWYQKDERSSRPWSHPVVLNTGLLDWQSSAWIIMGEKLSRIEIAYFLSSCLWHLNYNYLLYGKEVREVRQRSTRSSSWSTRIFYHFPKFISQLTKAVLQLFLRKDVLKICTKFKGENPCQSAISIKLHATLAWMFCCKFSGYVQNTFS